MDASVTNTGIKLEGSSGTWVTLAAIACSSKPWLVFCVPIDRHNVVSPEATAADREQVTAPARVVQEDVGWDADHDHHPEQAGNAQKGGRRERGERLPQPRDRAAVGCEEPHPAQGGETRQGHDERGQAELDDPERVEGAACR